jgi:tetratricopeptide (TPR) repeat protein
LTVAGIARAAPGGREEAGIVWGASWESAMEQAQVEGRIVMVDFYTTWCGWCKRLDRETYSDPRVIERCVKLVAVKIDGDRRRDLARQNGVTGYPTIGFFHPDGTPLQIVVGYQRADAFVALLDRLLDRTAEEFVLKQRLKDHPELLDVRGDLAFLLLGKGDAGEAIAHFDTLLQERDKVPPDRYWDLTLARGKALLQTGATREARRSLKDFVKNQKKSPRLREALFFLGEAALADGDRKEAGKCFRKLLDIGREGWLADRSRELLAGRG